MTDRQVIAGELRRLRQAGRQQPRVPPMPWALWAACKGHDPEDWMDDRPGRPTASARAACDACPVRTACLAHADAYDEPWGMWGGLTTRERMARRMGLALPSDAERPYVGTNGPRKTKPPGVARGA